MLRPKRTLAILAIASLLGCSPRISPATPLTDPVLLRIYSTTSTTTLLDELRADYLQIDPSIIFQSLSANHTALAQRLALGEMDYYLTHHISSIEGWWAAPIARDALILIVHPDNPVQDIDVETTRRLYQGFITNWAELGGPDMPVTLYSRETGSGVRAEFERSVMGQRRISPNAQVAPSAEAAQARIASDRGGIAYLAWSQLTHNEVAVMRISGNMATAESIANNLYPLRLTVFIVGRVEPAEAVGKFIDWIQSEQGQDLIAQRHVALP